MMAVHEDHMPLRIALVCLWVCVRAWVRAYVCVCVCVCVWGGGGGGGCVCSWAPRLD